jgi:hypothetical protein
MMNCVRAPRLLVVAVLACACACAGTPPPPQQPAAPAPADFFPLAIGNTWTFLDSSPQQLNDTQPTGTHHTIRIVRRDPDGYFVDDQQNALRADDDCLHDRERRLLCRPIQAGTTWTSVVSPTVTERYRIAGVGEKVTVPAGTFTGCVRVRSQARVEGVDQTAELTYAPGVGLIRLETFSVTAGGVAPQLRGELEAFRLVTASK